MVMVVINRVHSADIQPAMEGDSQEEDRRRGSLVRQMACAFLVNSVSFLQGASVSTSSIITPILQNSSLLCCSDPSLHQCNSTDIVNVCLVQAGHGLGSLFDDFFITEEESSWIGDWTQLDIASFI